MNKDDTTTDAALRCKHGKLPRSCESCLREAVDQLNEELDAVLTDVRDDYAQAALTGLLSRYGAEKIWREMVDNAFELADLAMERRKQR